MPRIHYESFEGRNDVISIPELNNLMITRPIPFCVEVNRLGTHNVHIQEKNNTRLALFISKDNKIIKVYCIPQKLGIHHPVTLAVHAELLATSERYNWNYKKWVSVIYYKDSLMSLYYDKAIMELVKSYRSGIYLSDYKDADEEFDMALYNVSFSNLEVLKQIWLSSDAKTGIKTGLLMWDDWYSYANKVCMTKHSKQSEIDMLLNGFEKRLFYFDFLLKEKRTNKEFLEKHFSIQDFSYSEENFKKLLEYLSVRYPPQKTVWKIVNTTYDGTDDEHRIMSALSSGNGDVFGF